MTQSIFLGFFSIRFVPRGKIHIKCTFSIVNYQPRLKDSLAEITDFRFWSTDVYTCIFLMTL